jgi:hypothetical protein
MEDRTLPSSGWAGVGGDAQHSGLAPAPAQPLQAIHWQTPVDLAPQYSGNELLIHYGSPIITPNNTVIVPVKTGPFDGFQVEAFKGTTGAPLWTVATDYLLPPFFSWTPEYAPVLAGSRLYFPGIGGKVYYVDHLDSPGPHSVSQVVFYGAANYAADPNGFNNSLYIDTPLTADANGDVFFAYREFNSNILNLTSGIARIDPSGNGTFISAQAASGNAFFTDGEVPHNCAPALSNDGKTLYIAVRDVFDEFFGYLVALDSTTLQPRIDSAGNPERVLLVDPRNSFTADLPDISTASPAVGPDGDVYFGILGDPFNGSRGWLLHFSADLSTEKTPGGFGWDDTVSFVPASMVPSYHGTSSYLLFSKYNNYAGFDSFSDWGNGVNQVAILDPNATQVDPHASSGGLLDMKVVMAIAGPTPDPNFLSPQFPNAVREWCINSAAVDPATDSVLVNSEDGSLYRWNLATGTLSQTVVLTSGLGEAYTPTVVGSDGTVYAINNATLFAVGKGKPAPAPLSVSATTVNLGTQAARTTGPALVGVTLSPVEANARYQGFTLTGPDAADFAVASPPAAGTLLPAAGLPLTFTFSPSHVGAESADLVIQTNYSLVTVHLKGTGLTPLRFSTGDLVFPAQTVNTTGPLKSVTLSDLAPGVQVLGVTTSGPDAADLVPLNAPGIGPLFPAPGNQVLFFSFTPSHLGIETADFTLNTNLGSVTLQLQGTGVTQARVRQLRVAGNIDFGGVTIGASAGALGTTLTNRGPGAVQILSINPGGADPGDFPLLAGPAPGSFPVGGQTLLFGYNPTHFGSESAAYTIVTSIGSITIHLQGHGNTPLAISSRGLTFGTVGLGASSQETAMLTNLDSGSHVQLVSIASSGPNAADFALVNGPPAGALPGGSQPLVFSFTPSLLGAESATFTFVTSAGTFRVALRGHGAQGVSLSTARVDLGSIAVANPILQQTVTLYNLGTVQILGVSFSGADQADFSLVNPPTPGQSLASGQNLNLTFGFTPSRKGTESITVTITTSVGTVTLVLTGVGL